MLHDVIRQRLRPSQAHTLLPGLGCKGVFGALTDKAPLIFRARYRDSSGKEHLKRFALKRDAQRWLDAKTAKLETGTWVAPRTARITVREWCDVWLKSYANRRPSTVRLARIHIAKITDEFGDRRLDSVRPSEVKTWTVRLKAEACPTATSQRSTLGWRRSTVTRSMTAWWRALPCLGARPHPKAGNVPT